MKAILVVSMLALSGLCFLLSPDSSAQCPGGNCPLTMPLPPQAVPDQAKPDQVKPEYVEPDQVASESRRLRPLAALAAVPRKLLGAVRERAQDRRAERRERRQQRRGG